MTPAPLKSVAAVVLASRGGARLERALDSVAWAAERIVLDPGGRVDLRRLPDDVRRGGDFSEVASAPWLLLLEEHETVSPPLAAAIAAALERPLASAYRIPQVVTAFGVTLCPRRAPVRLASRSEARLALRSGLSLELALDGAAAPRLSGRLLTDGAPTLAAAVEELDAEATTLAALLHARRVRPRFRHLVVPPLIAGARALLARGATGGFWGRWTLAVLGGYRVLVAYAKLWEMRRDEAARPR